MTKAKVIERLNGLIEYTESVKGDLELDDNITGADEWERDIEALKTAIVLLVDNKQWTIKSMFHAKKEGDKITK